tara:strand:- start:186 stop:950 length:765 start_codon:yes stop_codon:yes gene_type:complete
MISKNRFKYLKSLKIKKYRNQAKQILIEGSRLIDESMRAGANIELICYTKQFVSNSNHKKLLRFIDNKNILIEEISDVDMKALSDSMHNQGILGLADMPIADDTSQLICANQLILDSISDPGNLGNIMRTTDWFGIKSLYFSSDCIDPYNAKVIRSAMGAHFYLDIFHIDIIAHIKHLKENDFTIIAADLDGESVYNWAPPEKWAIILGNEAHGISDKIRKLVDCTITIPKQGSIESLNVSMATGIVLSHIKKI